MGKRMLDFGEPQDVEGECNAHLHIGDNFGDNHSTMRCQLPAGHEGQGQPRHKETWRDGKCVVTWEGDDYRKDIEDDPEEAE